MRNAISLSAKIVKQELRKGKKVIEIAKKYRVTRQAVYWHIYKARKKVRAVKRKPKKCYNHLIDWRIYNEGLVKRGEFILDFDFFKDWETELALLNGAKRGRPYEYPDSFMLFFLRLKCIFKIDYRTLEGVARKLVVFISQAPKAPDYTTFQVRLGQLEKALEVYEGVNEQVIAGDSSGLKTTNRGEYRMRRYRGKRKEFMKLHLAVNTETKQVIYCDVTHEGVRDGAKLHDMITGARHWGKVRTGYFDAGYDSIKNYGLLSDICITPVIRPRRSMSLRRVRKRLRCMDELGIIDEESKGHYIRLKLLAEYLTDKDKWRERYGYGKRWAVEGRYSVFKRMFSEYVFSKEPIKTKNEVMIKIDLMNLFTSNLRKAFQW